MSDCNLAMVPKIRKLLLMLGVTHVPAISVVNRKGNLKSLSECSIAETSTPRHALLHIHVVDVHVVEPVAVVVRRDH